MPTAYPYVRVSTLDQARFGQSLPTQEDFIQQFFNRAKVYFELICARKGEDFQLDLAQSFIDRGQSARKKTLRRRTEGSKLDSILRDSDHVIFPRMDRAFRNIEDFVTTHPIWTARGITIHFVDQMIDLSTANGQFAGNIYASVAQWESDMRRERALESNANRRKNGKRFMNGHKQIGYQPHPSKRSKAWIEDLVEREEVREICLMRVCDELSWEKISDIMEAQLASREGRPPIRPIVHDKGPKRKWTWARCRKAHDVAIQRGWLQPWLDEV